MSHNGELCFTLGNSLNSDDFTCFSKVFCQLSYFVSVNTPYFGNFAILLFHLTWKWFG